MFVRQNVHDGPLVFVPVSKTICEIVFTCIKTPERGVHVAPDGGARGAMSRSRLT